MFTRYMKCALFYIVCLTLIISESPFSYAQLINKDLPDRGGFKLIEDSSIMLHGAVKGEMIFDDNIYLAPNDKKSDWIRVIAPSVGIEIPIKDSVLSADYEMKHYNHNSYSGENHTDHRVRVLGEINLTDYVISIKDTYRRFTDRAANEDSDRIKQQDNIARVGISSERNKLGFDVGYTNKIKDYITDQTIFGGLKYDDKDYVEHMIDFQLIYRILPKTSIIAEADIGTIRYNSDLVPNSDYLETLLGVKGELTNKVTGNIKGGYRWQNYKSSDFVVRKNFDNFVARGGIEFRMTDRDLLNLSIERANYESTYRDMNYYESNYARLGYTHRFGNKVSLNSYGFYQYNRYPEKTTEDGVNARRHDKLFGGGAGLRYDIQKWCSLEAKYDYRERDSKFSKYDYKNNMVTFTATIGF